MLQTLQTCSLLLPTKCDNIKDIFLLSSHLKTKDLHKNVTFVIFLTSWLFKQFYRFYFRTGMLNIKAIKASLDKSNYRQHPIKCQLLLLLDRWGDFKLLLWCLPPALCVWQCYTPPCLAEAAPQASANQFPWFHGSTKATVDFLRGHLPLTGLFSSLMGDHLTLFMLCACEVNNLCVRVFVCVILFCACTCTDKGISLGLSVYVCEFTHINAVKHCMSVDLPTPDSLISPPPFLPMRQRGR